MLHFLRVFLLSVVGVALAFSAAAQGTPAVAGDVVINKIMNKEGTGGNGDAIEILVISDNVDLRGCWIKDFSTDGSADNGGKFRFNRFSPILSNLRAGTLIYIPKESPATIDTSYNPAGGDFLLQSPLISGAANAETGFFPNSGNISTSFFLGNDEIVMLMPASTDGFLYQGGNTSNPVNPFIHAFINGNARNFNATDARNVIGAYLAGGGVGDTLFQATATIPADPGNIGYATNPNTAASDFDNTSFGAAAAEGTVIDGTALAFGVGNNATNRNFIDALRSAVTSVVPGFATRSTIDLEAFPKPVRLGSNFQLKFGLVAADRVTIELLDLSGRKVATLQEATLLAAGDHALQLTAPEALNIDFGVYLVHLRTAGAGTQGYVKLPVYR